MKQICAFLILFVLIKDVKGQNGDTTSFGVRKAWIDSIVKDFRDKKKIICSAQQIPVQAYVKTYPNNGVIHIIMDSLLNGFKIELSDTTYKVVGFSIFYEFPGDPFGEDIIFENKVTPQNLPFLPHIKGYGEGYFAFTCIAIEKNGQKYNAKDFTIMLKER